MDPLILTIVWIICILWAIYYWYWNASPKRISNNVSKIVLDHHPDNRHSTSSIESLENSDNENIRRKNMQKLKYEAKTRWPSRTSVRARYSNKSL